MTATSVLVIGAGIVGCSVAYYLAPEADVLVVDPMGLATQASTQTAANLHFQLSYTALKGGEEEFRRHARIIELNDDADRRWTALASETGGRVKVVNFGGIVVAESDDDVDILRRKVELERAAGFTTEFVDRADLADLVPEVASGVRGASWHAREGYVDAKTACYELARAARERGARFDLTSAVSGLRRSGGRWRVDIDPGGGVDADIVVVAAGAWTERVLGPVATVPMEVSGLTMSVTEAGSRRVEHLVMHTSRPLSVKQVSSGNVMIGGGRPARVVRVEGPLGWRTEPLRASLRAGMDDAVRVVPGLDGLRVVRSWEGLLGSPADDIPVIGEVPGQPGLIVSVAGHTGYTLGPTCGWAAARLALGQDPGVDLTPFSPGRFAAVGVAAGGAR